MRYKTVGISIAKLSKQAKYLWLSQQQEFCMSVQSCAELLVGGKHVNPTTVHKEELLNN